MSNSHPISTSLKILILRRDNFIRELAQGSVGMALWAGDLVPEIKYFWNGHRYAIAALAGLHTRASSGTRLRKKRMISLFLLRLLT